MSVTIYADTTDVISYRGPQPASVLEVLDAHLEGCSARLRLFARNSGVDLDELYTEDEDLQIVITERVVDSVISKIASNKGDDPLLSQFSQAAGGYSISGTFVNIGGDYYFPKAFLRDIGITRQKISTFEVFEYELPTRTDN